MPLKVLLLQTREPGDPAKAQEVRSFAAKADLAEEQIVSYDLLTGPPSLSEVRAHDALMIGGSGEYYVSHGNLPGFAGLLELLGEVVDVGHPTFGSCFGFQCMVTALGGEIIHDPENTEVGTYELTLTKDGQQDSLLGELPTTFLAQMGRKDRAARLPDGVLHLASSARCPFQALRIPDQPIWAAQFHPELDRHENRRRFEQYMKDYAPYMSPEARQEALESFQESSPEVLGLLRRFLRLVFG